MPATLKSSLEVEDALVAVGEKMGMKVLLLRLVAANLPDNPWLTDLEIQRDGDAATVSTTHLCGAKCRFDASGCLTAFKIEDAVSKKLGELMRIRAVEPDGADRLRVRLVPWSA